MRRWGALLALAALLVPQGASARPACAGAVEIEHANIVRVEKNGALILADGRAAMLEGIRLPEGAADHAPPALAAEAQAMLAKLTVGHSLTLTAVPPKEDRYDRIRAQAFMDENWLQKDMLARGLARVSIAPDRVECADQLFDAETEARNLHQGLWSSPAYAVRNDRGLGADVGTFQLVEGKVASANVKDGRAWIDFGAPGLGGDFSALIGPDDLRRYRAMGVDPRGYAGKTILVRGIVENEGGPVIAIANPMQVEVIQP